MAEENKSISPAQPHPIDVMREVYRETEISFDEVDGTFFSRLTLENVEVQLITSGQPNDLVSVIIHFPIRATVEFRAKAGEFLHRLNFAARRKFWEIDYDDGEIRLAAYTDTLIASLTEDLFRSMVNALIRTADATFPYLTSVLSGRMSPEFAADQAMAATSANQKTGDDSDG